MEVNQNTVLNLYIKKKIKKNFTGFIIIGKSQLTKIYKFTPFYKQILIPTDDLEFTIKLALKNLFLQVL